MFYPIYKKKNNFYKQNDDIYYLVTIIKSSLRQNIYVYDLFKKQ